jgi:hypothetical protein
MARSDRKAESEITPIDNPYPVPLYLNQKYVFSILAMMEGGIAQLENIKSTRSDQEERSSKISGEIGLSNVFALLNLKLGGEKSTQRQAGDTQEISSERVHTPDSLFARLRERLYQDQALRREEIAHALPGEYVEFAVTLHKNPLTEVLETIRSFAQISLDVQSTSAVNSQIGPKGVQSKSGVKGGQQQPKTQSNTSQILKQIDVILKSLSGEEGGTFDLIGSVGGSKLQAVLVLDPNFASDPTSADLVDGEYTVLGKIVKVISPDSEETISPLRKTSLGKASPLVEQLVSSLAAIQTPGINLPKTIETELSGPVIQVVPIAIFM